MKYLTLLIAATFTFVPFSMAADDFGKPFTNEAPAGFGDTAPDDGSIAIENISPELIEPAAGDYFDYEEQGAEGDAENAQDDEAQLEEESEISL